MAPLGLSEYEETERLDLRRRLGLSPSNGNGRSVWVSPMIRWVVGGILSAVIAYYTTIMAMNVKMASIDQREQDHYSELTKAIQSLHDDWRSFVAHDKEKR